MDLRDRPAQHRVLQAGGVTMEGCLLKPVSRPPIGINAETGQCLEPQRLQILEPEDGLVDRMERLKIQYFRECH